MLLTLLEELTIILFYTDQSDYGLSDYLLHQSMYNVNRSLIRKNIRFYIPSLKQLLNTSVEYYPIIPPMPIIQQSKHYYNRSNPSIVTLNDRYLVCCRGVNYVQTEGSSFTSLSPDGIIRTINILFTFLFSILNT